MHSMTFSDPLFGLGANVALILAGQFMAWVTRREGALAVGGDAFAATLGSYMAAVVASGGIILGTYKYMQDRVIPTLESTKKAEEAPAKKKVKMTMRESFSFLAKSPYIRNLAILVMSSGLCLNLVEVSWKAKLKQLFPDPTSYSSFMGHFQSVTGAVTLGMMLMGRSIFANFGWGTAALVTPFVSINYIDLSTDHVRYLVDLVLTRLLSSFF